MQTLQIGQLLIAKNSQFPTNSMDVTQSSQVSNRIQYNIIIDETIPDRYVPLYYLAAGIIDRKTIHLTLSIESNALGQTGLRGRSRPSKQSNQNGNAKNFHKQDFYGRVRFRD